jgi:hypothetical protein
MDPVNVYASDILGEMAAASQIAFGAAVIYAADKTVKSTLNTVHNVIGIVQDAMIEQAIDGFYSQYDSVPIIPSGRCRLWVTSNEATKEDIEAGDYLEIAILGGGSNTLPVGVLQQMGAESGSCTGAVREIGSVAKALASMALTDVEPVGSAVSIGDTTITMASGDMTKLDLAAGDYILMEDDGGNCMINRVKSVTSTVITLQIPSTVAQSDTTNDDVHKLHQVEAKLI